MSNASFGRAVNYKDKQGYEEQLSKWSGKLGIDIDWLRKASYTQTGKDFLTFGDHYNNIVNFLSRKHTHTYIYLKDFKFRLLSANGFIDFIERKHKQKPKDNNTEDQEDGNKSWCRDFDENKFHYLMYGDIYFNKTQWQRLMEITGLESEDLECEQVSIPKDKAVLSGGSAKIIKVHAAGREEEIGNIKYDVDYSTYERNRGSAALKHLPKTIRTRTMREALKQVYMFDFAMMGQMASMEIIDEVEVSIIKDMQESNNVVTDEPDRTDLIAAKKAEKIKQALLGEEVKGDWSDESMDKAIKEAFGPMDWVPMEVAK